MGSLSDYTRDGWMNYVFNGTAFTRPSGLEVALFDGDPSGAGTECPGTNYARIVKTATLFGAASAGSITSAEAIDFATASDGTWGSVDYWALYDNTGTNLLAYGQINSGTPVTINSGNQPSIASTQITISTPAEMSNYLANALLDYVFRNTAYTSPSATLNFALSTTAIVVTDDGAAMDECTGNAYARVSNANWSTASAGSGAITTDTADVVFPTPTGDWAYVGVAVMDSATEDAGNILFYDNDMADDNTASGDTVQIEIGAFTATLS
jgi:hypothetical protein